MKKIIALLLAIAMVFSLVACGSKDEVAEKPADSATNVEQSDKQEPVTLKFYCYAPEQADQEAVFDKLNEYFVEKYNTTVEFHFVQGNYADKMSMVINSGEEYDACYTSYWVNDYATNVEKEAFLDISSMLDDYPDLYNSMPQAYWDAATIDGGIYAVPDVQIAARTPAYNFTTEYMEGCGLTAEDVLGWKSILDAKDYLQEAYTKYGAKFTGFSYNALLAFYGYEMINSQNSGMAIKMDDPTCKVVNFFETPEFEQYCYEIAELAALDLVDGNCSVDADYKVSQKMANRLSLYDTGAYKPGGDAEESIRFGHECTLVPIGSPLLQTTGITAALWGISTTSKHPDRVMQIMELLLTDAYVMNLISYGIEGVHYDLVDGFVQTKEGSGYAPGCSWAFGNVFLTYPSVGQTADVWEQTKTLNETAVVSPLIGYTYSAANVQTEAANVASVSQEYTSLLTGEVDVETTLAAFREKLQAAGIEITIADAQAQIDAFLGK